MRDAGWHGDGSPLQRAADGILDRPSSETGKEEFSICHPVSTSLLGHIPSRNIKEQDNSSGAPVPPKVETTSDSLTVGGLLPDEAFTTYGKIAKLQDRFLTDQTRLKYARNIMGSNFENLRESLSQFMKVSGSLDNKVQVNVPSRMAGTSAYDQLLLDIKDLEGQMLEITELEQSLGKLEYRLAKLHPKLLNLIEDRFKAERPGTGQPLSSTMPQPFRASSPPIQPLEQEYYDKRGDVRLLHDQIFNLQSRIQSALEDDTTHPIVPISALEDPSGHQQYAPYPSAELLQRDYEVMQQNLHQEERELKRRWKACKRAGLNVGSLGAELSWAVNETEKAPPVVSGNNNIIELDEPPFLPDRFLPQFFKNFRWPQRGALAGVTMPELAGLGDKRDMIERWLQEPSGLDAVFGQAGPSAAIEFEHTISTPKSDSDWVMLRKASEDVFSVNDSTMVSGDDKGNPASQPLQARGATRVLREWKSDEALRLKSGQRTRLQRASAVALAMRQHLP